MGKVTSALRSQEIALERVRMFSSKARARCAELGWELVGVYLVGSRARGDYLADSDVDVVLVVKGRRRGHQAGGLQGRPRAGCRPRGLRHRGVAQR